MGVVLAVCDEVTGEPLALKLLSTSAEQELDSTDDEEERAARLLREARAMMRLSSPHVVRVRDCGLAEGGPYLLMERLEGSDLAELNPLGSQMPWREAVDVAIQVCEALSHAHKAGIIHRDIKPSNLFLCRAASGDVVKVLDFGISKITSRAEWERTASLTKSEILIGSPQFVSPEHLRDPKSVDARTDIWSIGVVLFRLLTGQYAFGGATLGQLFVAVLEHDAPSLASCGVDAPREIQAIVNRCLARDRADRYSTVGQLALDLAPLVSPRWAALADAIVVRVGATSLPRAATSSQGPATAKPKQRRSRAVASSVALGLVVFAAVAVGRNVRTEANGAGAGASSSATTSSRARNTSPATDTSRTLDPPIAAPMVTRAPSERTLSSDAAAVPRAEAPAPSATARPSMAARTRASAEVRPPPSAATPASAASDLHENPYAQPSAP
jgi:serine/threonine-protein kinase